MKWDLRFLSLSMAVFLAFLIIGPARIHNFVNASEWYGVIWWLEEHPHYEWTVASGEPHGYEVFACNRDGSVCHWVVDVSEPRIVIPSFLWENAKRRLGVKEPRLKVRAFRGDEVGPYSELTEAGIGSR